jgi:hypothetical protein
MLITLPKLTIQNKYKETAIFVEAIKGFEPTEILYKGVKSEGVKVYTTEGFFKVFASPVEFATKLVFAKKTGESVNVLPIGKVGNYQMLDVVSVNANVKMLNAGGKQ